MKKNYFSQPKKFLAFILLLSVICYNATATTPSVVTIYNFGGSAQLTFNNSISAVDTPMFRVATSSGDNPTEFVIEINTESTFTGTDFLQTFAGSYIEGIQYNLTFNNGFNPISGTTYYVRSAASADGGSTYGAYSPGVFSFTYQSGGAAAWYQTTQAQFLTDSLSGVIVTSDTGVIVNPANPGTNVFLNPSFETGSASWTASVVANPSGSINTAHFIGIASSGTNSINGFPFTPPSPSPVTDGTYAMVMCNDAFGFSETESGGDYVVAQTGVDLTGVKSITFSQTFSDWAIGGCSGGVYSESNLEVIIDPANSSHGTAGTVVYTSTTWTGACLAEYTTVSSGPATKTIILPDGIYGSNCSVKFVWVTLTDAYSTFADAPTVYIDNVQSSSSTPSGTIISSAIDLASFQGATRWSQLQWNQTLNGGTIAFAVQKCISETWTDEVAGISFGGDGAVNVDISSIPVTTSSDSIRIVAILTAADSISPSFNSWTVSTSGGVATGINKVNQNALPGFDAYPNPANDELHFDFYHLTNQPADIELVNSIGQTVYTEAINDPGMIISMKNLSNGIYLARFVTADNAQSLKIVVRH